jgi:hypothetical protein
MYIYTYTYLFLVQSTESHVARMQTKFRRSWPASYEGWAVLR